MSGSAPLLLSSEESGDELVELSRGWILIRLLGCLNHSVWDNNYERVDGDVKR